MCGRFAIAHPTFHRLEQVLGTTFPPVPLHYNVAPSQIIPTLRQLTGGYEQVDMRWGLIPHWSKEAKTSYSTHNARAETVADKPLFKSSFRARRCLIPVSGFYEWQTLDDRKQPYYFTGEHDDGLVFAGLWDEWHGEVAEERILSCTIVVGVANPLVAPVHDRMPVILPEMAYKTWLDPHTPMEQIKSLLVPFPAAHMRGWRVSAAVGNPRNQTPTLIEPL